MWYAKNSASSGQGIVIDEQTGRSVAVVYDVKDTALLAAAPELLAACVLFEDLTRNGLAPGSEDLRQLQNAIAKATGND